MWALQVIGRQLRFRPPGDKGRVLVTRYNSILIFLGSGNDNWVRRIKSTYNPMQAF
jgi:hypothetical protein